MYARGAPLPSDERELCRLCGCATARSLRPLMGELLNKGKLKLVDGHLVNGRAMEEIAKFDRQKVISSKGGKAHADRVRAEFGSNSTRTQAETRADIVENQCGNECPPSPSPSKVPPTEGAGAPFDPEKPVFDYGKEVLGKSAGGQVRNLIRHHSGDLDAALETLRLAARKSSPREYVGAILRGDRQPETDWDVEYRRMGVSS
jgi:hypothetical protein